MTVTAAAAAAQVQRKRKSLTYLCSELETDIAARLKPAIEIPSGMPTRTDSSDCVDASAVAGFKCSSVVGNVAILQ